MKLINVFLIISFIFISWTKADDISEFKIEGIGLGDSLLNFFDENKIIKSKRDFYNDDEFLVSLLPTLEEDTMYGYIQVHYKKNDKRFIVYGIDGLIDVDIQECLKMQKMLLMKFLQCFQSLR